MHFENAHSWCHHRRRRHCYCICCLLFSNEATDLLVSQWKEAKWETNGKQRTMWTEAHVSHCRCYYCCMWKANRSRNYSLSTYTYTYRAEKSYFGCDLLHFVPYIYIHFIVISSRFLSININATAFAVTIFLPQNRVQIHSKCKWNRNCLEKLRVNVS